MDSTKSVSQSELARMIEQERIRSNSLMTEILTKEEKSGSKIGQDFFSTDDTVKLGLAKQIQEELNVDRSERIAALKALVASGNYKPDLKEVAQAIATTIDDEITLEKLGNA